MSEVAFIDAEGNLLILERQGIEVQFDGEGDLIVSHFNADDYWWIYQPAEDEPRAFVEAVRERVVRAILSNASLPLTGLRGPLVVDVREIVAQVKAEAEDAVSLADAA